MRFEIKAEVADGILDIVTEAKQWRARYRMRKESLSDGRPEGAELAVGVGDAAVNPGRSVAGAQVVAVGTRVSIINVGAKYLQRCRDQSAGNRGGTMTAWMK